VYAEEKGHSRGDDIDLINDVIEAQNDDGNQEIASTDCHQPVSGFVDGDIVQDCNALAANGDISQETTEVDNGEEPGPTEPVPQTCEECIETLGTNFQIFIRIDGGLQIPIGGGSALVGSSSEAICNLLFRELITLEMLEGALLDVPPSVGLTSEEIDKVIECLERVLET
jgi:hypothetical protein